MLSLQWHQRMGSLMAKFQAAVVRGFKNWNNFSGRAAVPEYWYFVLAMYILNFLVGLASNGSSGSNIVTLVFFVPGLAAGIRRMHDTGRSGWWLLLPIVNFVFLCGKPEAGLNKYGPPSPPLV